jgi:hypothetical protein
MSAHDGWAAGLQQVHAEAGGLLDVHVIEPSRVTELLFASLGGDDTATRLLRAAISTLANVHQAPRKRPALCLCCPRAIRHRDQFIVCITIPRRDNPSMGIGSAICAKCFADPTKLMTRIVEALKQMWPEVRPIGHVHEAPEAVQ